MKREVKSKKQNRNGEKKGCTMAESKGKGPALTAMYKIYEIYDAQENRFVCTI